MKNIIYEDIVKIMERGQVTLPVKVREMFNWYKGIKLWVRVTDGRKLFLEPIKNTDKAKKLSDWLKKMANDKTIYWTKEDDKNLQKVRNKTKERLKRLVW